MFMKVTIYGIDVHDHTSCSIYISGILIDVIFSDCSLYVQ